MDKRIAAVALALLLVAGVFLAWPTTPNTAPVPGAAGPAGAEGVVGAPSAAGVGQLPPQPPETEISIRCRPLFKRIAAIADDAYAKKVGTAAKEKFVTDEAVIVECEKLAPQTDDQINAWILANLNMAP